MNRDDGRGGKEGGDQREGSPPLLERRTKGHDEGRGFNTLSIDESKNGFYYE